MSSRRVVPNLSPLLAAGAAIVLACAAAAPAPVATTAPPAAGPSAPAAPPAAPAARFEIRSTAFDYNKPIPAQYTCDGADLSPPLTWTNVPAGTKSFVLIVSDPDAPSGQWAHWLLWDLPAGTTSLPQGVPKTGALPDGSRQGKNDFGNPGWGGPCPPGGRHRYVFRLFAMDRLIGLPPDATRDTLEKSIQGHIVGQTEVTGRYQRPRS